jgi:sigma-B regulation protein RsbU (phosphoserine phosphatase)
LNDADRQLLGRLGVHLIVPVVVKDEAVAFFWLGPRVSGDEYDEEDREFLTALADQTAGALDRLRLGLLEHDAGKAWQAQLLLLPHELPQTADFQIGASCRPARFVAGDYYDVVTLGERRVAVCIADVMGKGMPAAMQMANLQAGVRHSAPDTTDPNVLCGDLNRRIAGNMGPGQFITFFYAIIDAARRVIRYSNAGHNPPVLVRANGTVDHLPAAGPPLGLFPDWNHGSRELAFEPGDRLLLYTDGVTELRNAAGDEFGEERLVAVVQSRTEAPDLHQEVVDALHAFSGGAIQDDVTVMAVTMRSLKNAD